MTARGVCNDSLHHVVNRCANLWEQTQPQPSFGRLYATVLVLAGIIVIWSAIEHSRKG